MFTDVYSYFLHTSSVRESGSHEAGLTEVEGRLRAKRTPRNVRGEDLRSLLISMTPNITALNLGTPRKAKTKYHSEVVSTEQNSSWIAFLGNFVESANRCGELVS